ncbi:RNA polymerase subunit sigma-24 [Candidatus Poribacteria bacterium]|nr:MAG: RNA polymerase subunit sigma-24 [Candidatus Poribacteria bacterium]
MRGFPSDEELMKRCKSGDLSAFELLVLRYKDEVMNFIYHVIGDYHRAEDLCQETFIKVFENAGNYRPRERFRSWLFTIAVNLCRNELRYRARHKAASLEDLLQADPLSERFLIDRADTPDMICEKKEREEIVRRAIESLPESQRMALVLREYDSLRYDEIASALGCSVSAVKSLIHRARQNLRKVLLKAGLGEGYNAGI